MVEEASPGLWPKYKEILRDKICNMKEFWGYKILYKESDTKAKFSIQLVNIFRGL